MKTNTPSLRPSTGKILVSKPFTLQDDSMLYKHSVILLVNHEEEEFTGLVLNRPYSCCLNDCKVEGFPQFDSPVYCGGSMSPDFLNYVHVFEDIEGSIEIAPGIYFGGENIDLVDKMNLQKVGKNDIRFFYGNTMWAPGELEEEIKRQMWFVLKSKKELVFFDHNHPGELWGQAMHMTESRYATIMEYFPEDPSLS